MKINRGLSPIYQFLNFSEVQAQSDSDSNSACADFVAGDVHRDSAVNIIAIAIFIKILSHEIDGVDTDAGEFIVYF